MAPIRMAAAVASWAGRDAVAQGISLGLIKWRPVVAQVLEITGVLARLTGRPDAARSNRRLSCVAVSRWCTRWLAIHLCCVTVPE